MISNEGYEKEELRVNFEWLLVMGRGLKTKSEYGLIGNSILRAHILVVDGSMLDF